MRKSSPLRSLVPIVPLWALLVAGALHPSPAYPAEPRYGGTLRAGVEADPPGLDPHLFAAEATRTVMEHVYDTLVSVDADGRYGPALAESWRTSTDGLTWTFALRRNVRFHHGRPLAADDVVFSLNRIRDPRTRAPRAADLAEVEAVAAPDPVTVVIRLKRPYSPLLGKLSFATAAIVPRDVVERDGDLNASPTGTGPFRFIGYIPQQRLVLVRNGAYWGFDEGGRRLPYLDRLEFAFIPDATARVGALRAATADWIDHVPALEVRPLEADPNLEVAGGPGANFRALYINTASSPFSNVRVRRAMAWAISPREIVDVALGAGGVPTAGGPIPPGSAYAVSRNAYARVDLDRARRLLADAGQAGGFEAELAVTSTYDFLRAPADSLQAQLARIGIRLRIVAADWSGYFPTVMQKRYGLTVLGAAGQLDPDDYLYPHFRTGVGLNLVNHADPEFDRLVDEGRTATNEVRRRRLYELAQRRLQETVPMVFLFHSAEYVALRRTVRGYEHRPQASTAGLRRAWTTGR